MSVFLFDSRVEKILWRGTRKTNFPHLHGDVFIPVTSLRRSSFTHTAHNYFTSQVCSHQHISFLQMLQLSDGLDLSKK